MNRRTRVAAGAAAAAIGEHLRPSRHCCQRSSFSLGRTERFRTGHFKNAAQQTKGKVKEAAGKATDNERSKPSLKQAGENVKESFRHGLRAMLPTAPTGRGSPAIHSELF